MKVYKTVKIPKTEKQICTHILCDFCKEVKGEEQYEGVNWDKAAFDFHVITIRVEIGCRYPEGGDKEISEWHICPVCFEERILPVLPPPNVEEVDTW